VTLGGLVSITEGSAGSDPAPLFRAEAASTPVPLAGGELGLTATVTLQYRIVD
jgi:uncharacterized protein YggE